jgi:hypothetical protein
MRRRNFLAGPLMLGTLRAAGPSRPHLFVTPAKLGELKRKISGSHADLWRIVRENADRHVGRTPSPKYDAEGDMRSNGRGIPWQALAWLISGEPRYRDGAKQWMHRICEFPRWENNKSLAAGECLFGVAVGYDWLYDQLDDSERKFVREKLATQAEALLKGPVHRGIWLANHNHIEHLGLAAAGFALQGEVPGAEAWIQEADSVFRKALEFSGRDGGSTEGHQYWAYSAEAILRYAELARGLLKEDLYRNEWLRSVPDFIIHSTPPGFDAENCVMSFGDSHRSYDSHGPAHILYRTAAEYRNPYAQWLAQEMVKRGVGRNAYCGWASLLWYDETLAPAPVSKLPVYSHSDDVGWVTGRGSWGDDAVMTGFKCSPMHGHKAQTYYNAQPTTDTGEVGGGHGHADVNAFQVYAFGKWLAIDPGYERPKWTRNHNTVLVNGQGQLGEGETWFNRKAVIAARATSAILKAEHRPGYDYTLGDAMSIYPAAAGLTRFRRHFIFLRPDYIVVADELRASKPAQFDWLLHVEETVEANGGLKFLVRNGGIAMDVEFLLPKALVATQAKGLVTATAKAAPNETCLLVAVLHPRKVEAPPMAAPVVSKSAGRLAIALGGSARLELDLAGQRLTVA